MHVALFRIVWNTYKWWIIGGIYGLGMLNYTFKIFLTKKNISLIKEEKNEGKGNSLRKTLALLAGITNNLNIGLV